MSKDGIQAMIQKAHLNNWRIIEVHKQHSQVAHHIIIDEQAVGKEPWHNIVATMQRHLLSTEQPGNTQDENGSMR